MGGKDHKKKSRFNLKEAGFWVRLGIGLIPAAMAFYGMVLRDCMPASFSVHLAPTSWRIEDALMVPRQSGALLVVTAYSHEWGMPNFGRVMTVSIRDGRLLEQRYYDYAPKILGVAKNVLWLRFSYEEKAVGLELDSLEELHTASELMRKAAREKLQIRHVVLFETGELFVKTEDGDRFVADPASARAIPMQVGEHEPPNRRGLCHVSGELPGRITESVVASGLILCDLNTGHRLDPGQGDRLAAVRSGTIRTPMRLARLGPDGKVPWVKSELDLTGSVRKDRGRTIRFSALYDGIVYLGMEDGTGRHPDLRDDLYLTAVHAESGKVIWRTRID